MFPIKSNFYLKNNLNFIRFSLMKKIFQDGLKNILFILILIKNYLKILSIKNYNFF